MINWRKHSSLFWQRINDEDIYSCKSKIITAVKLSADVYYKIPVLQIHIFLSFYESYKNQNYSDFSKTFSQTFYN